ncbi:hypothetical protein MCG98_07765 [Ruminococcus sp. OA3]|uniref:hypothetical protein n=1 Tax=Ruminococcus sp. OA3 TaxID=2914164 RepID=UPI001F064818|nr:hypothetical protein [Ruminococcus sp. OA3]MCH1982460.1 hypothetical protein [Ruminococcus sp. OA3]
MNELTTLEKQLPNTIEDVAKFALIGVEKLKSLKAEIRAIQKIQLAKEVYDQKLEEQRLLSELILDAYVKLGEFSKHIPKQSGLRSDLTSYPCGNEVKKTKEQTMKDLGFSKKQTYEFETLADNKEIVEQAKQKAKEVGEPVTKNRILDFVSKKTQTPSVQKKDDFYSYMDECGKVTKKYHKAIGAFMYINADEKEFKMLSEVITAQTAETYLHETEDSISKLLRIQNYMKEVIHNGKNKNIRT